MPSKRKSNPTLPVEWPFWVWPLGFLIPWQILLWAQNPGLMSDDSGEMAAASYGLGIAHPPGYPLFCLLGRLFSFLPLGQPAFRFNLLAAVSGLLALLLLLDLCRLFLRNKEISGTGFDKGLALMLPVGAALFLFTNNDFFSQCMTAKGAVYTLTLLFLCAFWNLYIRDQEGMAPKVLAPFLVFLMGLGLAHHWQTQVLWIPFMAFWIHRRREKWSSKKVVRVLAFALLGLSLYLYLPLRGNLNVQPSWGAPQVWPGFRWVVSRAPFAGLEPAFRDPKVYFDFAGEFLETLSGHWVPGFAFAALFGLWVLWKKAREYFHAILLLYLPMVLGILTVPRPETEFLIPVYLVPANALWAFLGFVALAWAGTWLQRFRPAFAIALVTAGLEVLLTGWVVFQTEDKSQYFAAGDFGLNALKNLPRRSLFLAEGDHYVMPILYQRYALGLRPDLAFLPAPFLSHSWGWDQLGRQDGFIAGQAARTPLFSERMKALTGVPGRFFFYSLGTEYLGSELVKLPGTWVPFGLAWKWVPRPQPVARVLEEEGTALSRERLRGILSSDLSTNEIARYYRNQAYLAARWLEGQERESAGAGAPASP